jgi:NAD(P)-dependent dehydrogenase (short-subunit alcohol dehydrogenase family)
LAERGADVVLADVGADGRYESLPYRPVDEPSLDALAAELRALGRRCLVETVDLRSRTGVRRLVERTVEELGAIDVLVVASGVASVVPVSSMSDRDWDEVVDTNLHGLFNVAREVVPVMVARSSGRVVVIVGDEARRGVAKLAHVAAAAWAAIGLAKSIALETARSGVAVNVVVAGWPEGPFTSTSAFRDLVAPDALDPGAVEAALAERHPNGAAWVDADAVVDAVLFCAASRTTAMTGSVIDVTDGASALNTA